MTQQQAREDLALIRRLMEEGRRAVVDRGTHFVIWGVVSVVGLPLTYLFAVDAVAWSPRWTWSVLLVLGWLASFVVGWRESRGARVRTLGRRVLSALWIATAVTLTLIALAGMFGNVVPYVALPGLISAVAGSAVVVTGLLAGERWLGWVGVGWWLGGGLMLFVGGPYTLLVMTVMALLLMLVPGMVLHARSRAPSSAALDVP